MFDARAWAARLAGQDCAVCALPPSADDPRYVAALPSGPLILQDDADFPGYCILYYRRHVAELTELSADERATLMENLHAIARAIQTCCRPAKLNYACLGNEVPHLHWHIVPRYPDDGWWGRAFSLRPAGQRRPLPPGELERLRQALRAALG